MCWPFLILVLYIKGACCLKMVSLQVPSRAVVGDTIQLSCAYDLESDILYSIKWYRDDVEFFRFVPRDKPPGQFFALKGVRVDLVRSVNGTVFLQETEASTAGTFKCEVSADAPSFQTVSAYKKVVISEFDPNSATSRDHLPRLLLSCGLLFAFVW